MQLNFEKYSATGNDFIVIDNRNGEWDALIVDPILKRGRWNGLHVWRELCRLKTGIGADGILFCETSSRLKSDGKPCDFKMRYLNADGGEVSMCGNGTRALSAFYHRHFRREQQAHYFFETQKGIYQSYFLSREADADLFKIKMTELYDLDRYPIQDLYQSPDKISSRFLNTGVPHVVMQVSDVQKVDVFNVGKAIRYDARFEAGTNANFFHVDAGDKNKIWVRTYERGVENETESCGTGIVASALTYMDRAQIKHCKVQALGGELSVECLDLESGLEKVKEVYLCGKVQKIFDGSVEF